MKYLRLVLLRGDALDCLTVTAIYGNAAGRDTVGVLYLQGIEEFTGEIRIGVVFDADIRGGDHIMNEGKGGILEHVGF